MIEVLGPAEIYKGVRYMPVTEEFQQKFDHDLEFGRLGEDFVKAFGKLSGLSVTDAETWIHLLSYNNVIEGGFIFKTSLLKEKIKKLHKEGNLKLTMGGDDKMSQMALLPIKDLF